MSKKILVCDDDEGILDVISMTLTMFGFDVIVQQHSINVFNDIEKYNPGLIILDLWMPHIGGEMITKKLKESPDTKNIPVLITSASRDGEAIAHKVNADGFIAKPFDIHDLLATVQTFVSN